MDDSRSADPEYVSDRAKAEQRFYLDSTEWRKTPVASAARLHSDPIAEVRAHLTKVVAAAWSGKTVPAEPRSPVDRDIVFDLAKVCEEFVSAELTVFLALLLRRYVAKSRAATDLDERATFVLEKTHRRKWSPRAAEILSLFPGSSRVEGAWNFAKEHTEEYLREVLPLGIAARYSSRQMPPLQL